MNRESSSSLTEAPTPTPAPAPALTNAIRVSSLVFSWSNNSYVSKTQSSIAIIVLIKSTTLIPLHISTLTRSMLLLPLVPVSWPAWLVEGGVSALLQDWAGSLSYKEKKRPVIYNTWLYSTSNTHSHQPELLPREDFLYHWQTGRLSCSS